MHSSTHSYRTSRFGKLTTVFMAAVILSLAACGGSDDASVSGDGSIRDAQASKTPAVDHTDAADESNDADPSSGGADAAASGPSNPPGPSGGPSCDPDWPEQVWIPASLDFTSCVFDVLGEGAYMVIVTGMIDMNFEELRDALISAHGVPNAERDMPSGSYTMSYEDLVSASTVGFELVPEDGAVALVIRMAPD